MAFTNRSHAAEDFDTKQPAVSDPSYYYEAITKGDTAGSNFSGGKICRSILAQADGTFSVVRADGTALSIFLVKGYNPIMAIRVNATGSDAVNLWALF